MNFSGYVIPTVVTAIVAIGAFKKVEVFDLFCQGAKDGLNTAINILPPLVALMTGVGMLKASGIIEWLSQILQPITEFVGIPKGVTPLMLLKPFSGSGSIAILDEIFEEYGPDSFTGRVASVIAGSTETTFYTLAVYYGSVGIKKVGCGVASSVMADITGFIVGAVTVIIFLQ